MAKQRIPVMADVAARAGVSAMTVSRVLNGTAPVSEDTRARVEEAVAALGFRANAAARALAGGRSRVLGVVAVETTFFGPANTLFGIEAAARASGHFISFVTVARPDAEGIEAAVDHLRGAHAEGVIVLAPNTATIDAVSSLHPNLPLVVTADFGVREQPRVAIDQVEGARLATSHLLDLGHRTVHHVRGPARWADATARAKGWRQVLRRRGAPVPDVGNGDWSPASGYAAGKVLAADRRVTAVFVANDQMALGVLLAMREAGRDVPGDVSVVGFDDTPESAFFAPPLTTVRQDYPELGRRCVEELLARIAGDTQVRHVDLVPELVVRSSTAVAR